MCLYLDKIISFTKFNCFFELFSLFLIQFHFVMIYYYLSTSFKVKNNFINILKHQQTSANKALRLSTKVPEPPLINASTPSQKH